jgi:hypothetical protein
VGKNEEIMINTLGFDIKGFIKITDLTTNEIIVEKNNQVHYENLSESLANTLANRGKGQIFTMGFGNGGSSVNQTGTISYLPPNVVGQNAALYNQTYSKIVDDTSVLNTNSTQNKMSVLHTSGKVYTDILIQCILDYGEPAGQPAFDNNIQTESQFTFDELGLIATYGTDAEGLARTRLLTHVVFHPIQKALNRQYQIDYTIRIQSITNQVTI